MRIPFAWSPHLERYVSPQEVERGLKCGCICRDCFQNVICKQGEKKSWHFAHQSNSDCRGEGMIHRLAKDVLKQSVGKNILLLGLREVDFGTIRKIDLEVWMPKAYRRIDAGVELLLPNGNTQKIVLEICVSNPKCKAYIRDMSTAYKRTPILELFVDSSLFWGVASVQRTMQKLLLENNNDSCPRKWLYKGKYHLSNRVCPKCGKGKQVKDETCWDCVPRRFKCQKCNGPKKPGHKYCLGCSPTHIECDCGKIIHRDHGCLPCGVPGDYVCECGNVKGEDYEYCYDCGAVDLDYEGYGARY